ncbi:MAG: DUF3332 family protein [Candidatus Cloacimonetes bacterium]|nr:DUF3332 family protein [Candidatus Cloacimonadota bacterium]
MKKCDLKIIFLVLIISILSLGLTGCFGKFQLTRNLYTWNSQIGGKWVNTLVMWILFIIPVYEIAGFVDFAILNVIEFWTGDNPVTMGPDEKETQLVKLDDMEYEITATKNRFDIKEISNGGIIKSISLIYDEDTKSWFVTGNNFSDVKIAQLDPVNLNVLHLIKPDGQMVDVDIQSNRIIFE